MKRMAPDDNDDPAPADPKVKDLLASGSPDETALRRDLERWFGLPSFTELAERPPRADDPEVAAVLAQRDAAIAAVDPALSARIRARTEDAAERMLRFEATIDLTIDPELARFDASMAGGSIAEPREVEIPEALIDDLKECTPQALLRDLHRPELDFEKQLEMVDGLAAQRIDIVAEVEAAMTTSWKLPPLGASPYAEGRALLADLRAYRARPWPDLFAAQPLPNRRVS